MVGSFLNGFDLMNKSSFDRPGSLYSCFFQLATGLERLMKIAFIIDHKAKNKLSNPSDKQLRNLGHNLVLSYENCKSLAKERNASSSGWFDADTNEHRLLSFLSEFADGSRYYNLNQLVGGRRTDDPLRKWFKVHMAIAESYLPYSKLEQIMQLARSHCDKFKFYGYELSPRGEYELTVDITYQLEVLRRTRGHCVWTMIRTLKPFYNLLDRLCDEVHSIEISQGIETPTVPYMIDFISFFLCDRQTSTCRKSWFVDYPR